MIKIFRDETRRISVIQGVAEGIPQTFTPTQTGTQLSVFNEDLQRFEIKFIEFDQIVDGDGNGFATAALAFAYLVQVFAPFLDESGRLVVEREAVEVISALKLVKSAGAGLCEIASPSGSFENAQVLGVALNAANIGEKVRILTFGGLDDASFVFSADQNLYLGEFGNLTTTPVIGGYDLTVGKVLGLGEIWVDIKEIIQLA